jgi:hypothetical protein
VYAIGDQHHLGSNTADMFIAREIPVRDNVIMANRKMAGEICNTPYCNNPATEKISYSSPTHRGLIQTKNVCKDCGNKAGFSYENIKRDKMANRKMAGGDDPRIKGASRRAQATFKQYLAEVERLAAGEMSYDETINYIDRTLAEGEQFVSPRYIGPDPKFLPAEPEKDEHVERGLSDLLNTGGGHLREIFEGKPVKPRGGPSGDEPFDYSKMKWENIPDHYDNNHTSSVRQADWTKYDSPDPINDMGKSKPASTSVAKPPKDWATRLPKGDPSKKGGTWTPPTIPRKKK